MNEQSQLAFLVTFDGCMWAGTGAFLVWVLVCAVRGLAREQREGWKQIPREDLTAHRVTPRFSIPTTMKDCK